MKKISTAAALLAAGALLFGSLIVACSPHGTGIIDEGTKTTAGTISANAVSGTTATLTDSTGGTYTFISGASASIVPVLSTVSTPAGGTWTYKEKNISFNKYEGTFTGDIAKIGKEATSFKLTVKKVANAKGELMTAKKEASFDFNLTTSAFTATIPEVEASATKAEEEPEVVADPKTVVNAKFDFLVTSATAGINLNTETDLTEYAKPASDVVTAAKGASLKFITGSGSKVKYENNTNYGLYVGSKKDSLSTVAAAGSYKEYYSNKDWIYGKLELETTDSAKITLNVSGNGDTHYGRWVVVTNVKGKIVGFAENLGRVENGTTEIKELKVNDGNLVNKGKYTIWMHGSRINSITVKNDLKADIVEIPIKTITLASDKTTLKVGATTPATLTATVKGENDLIPNVTYELTFEVTEGADYVTLTQDTTNKLKATITVKDTVTSAQTVKIIAKAGTVKSEPVTITVDKASSVAKATAKTYNFVGLSPAAFKVTNGTVLDSFTAPGEGKTTADTDFTGEPGTCTIENVGIVKINSPSNRIKITADANSKTTAIKINGSKSETTDISTGFGGTVEEKTDRWISIEVDGAGKIEASITWGSKSSINEGTGPYQAGFFKADGTLLGTILTSNDSGTTVTGTTTEATTVYLVYSRNGAKQTKNDGSVQDVGSMSISKIEVTPAE